MALDNAQFISELSITDPPGTDAVAEGDDHIRTTKRATQQSFPNVDAAVPQTAAQMGQMAIKNEANTFSLINTFTNQLIVRSENFRLRAVLVSDNVSVSYLDEVGFVRWEAGRVNTTTSGNYRVRRFDAAGVFVDSPLEIFDADGAVNVLTELAVNQVGTNVADVRFKSVAGFNRWILRMDGDIVDNDFSLQRRDAAGVFLDAPISITAATGRVTLPNIAFLNGGLRTNDGSATTPPYAFNNSQSTGMYSSASNVLNLSTAGGDRLALTASESNFKQRIWVPDGSSTAPSYTFSGHQDTGLFIQAGANLGFSAGGVRRMLVKSNTVNLNLPTTSAGLSSGDCFVSSGFVAIVP